MQSELMTPRIGSATSYPLSAITIQSLADLGYTVDATQADAYTLPATSKIAIESEVLILQNCIVIHPEAGPGQVRAHHTQSPKDHGGRMTRLNASVVAMVAFLVPLVDCPSPVEAQNEVRAASKTQTPGLRTNGQTP